MKKIIISAIFLVFGLTFKIEASPIFPNGEYAFFYSNLAPYGNWIQIDYNTVVWSPRIHERNWAPYTAGRWIWTSDGWYWDSYEPFGYITYHYGRWYYDSYYGWLWVPDYQWAPAWVEWRYDDAYIGWAPLPPYAAFSINVGIYFTTTYYTPYTHWHFVSYNYFCDPYVSKYYLGPKIKYRIFSKTKYRNDYGFSNGRVVNRGVDVDYIRNRTSQRIVERNITAISDPGKIERGNERTRDNDNIRAFIATRDELSRGNTDNIKVQRADRKSTLETSKIELNRTRDLTPRVRENNSVREAAKPEENSRDRVIERKAEPSEKNSPRIIRNETKAPSGQIKKDQNVYIPKKDVSTERINKNRTEPKREVRIKENKPERTNFQIVPKRETSQPQIKRESRPQTHERSKAAERSGSRRSRNQ